MVFINASGDTFTPTMSGSLGPWIWEMCQAAKSEGFEPAVISKRQKAATFPWPKTTEIDWPWIPKGRIAGWLLRANRKYSGWAEFGQGVFARRVARAIKAANMEERPMFLQNDPEIAVYLRRRFPKSILIAHFQNQQECRPRFRRAFRHAVSRVTACSDFTARWVEKYYALAIGSVDTVYSGVDSQRFVPAAARRPKPVINFTGRTGIEKAPDLLLSAALSMAEKTQDFELQILGASVSGWQDWNPYQQKLQDQIEKLTALGVTVRWPGHIDRHRIVGEIQKADIHVTPSRWDEPFGLVTLEAMSCGLPTVASRTGGTPEVVGEGGLLFERDSVEDLKAKLEPLIKSTSLRNEWGAAARRRAEQMPWRKTWRKIQEVLEAAKSDIRHE